MKKQILFLIFAVLLTSCTQGQTPATPTVAPIATPIPSATATLTPIPTVTNTPTEVPIPANEYQVVDANGNTLIVVNDQLFKWENGKQISVAIENVVFDNAIDAANVAKVIAPEKYFEGDQRALKDILFPEGVVVNSKVRLEGTELVGGNTYGIILMSVYGVPVSTTRIRIDNSNEAVVLNVAVLNSNVPVPVIIGRWLNGVYQHMVNNDKWVSIQDYSVDPSYMDKHIGAIKVADSGMSGVMQLIGRPVLMDVVTGDADTDGQMHFPDDIFKNIGQGAGKPFFDFLINRYAKLFFDSSVGNETLSSKSFGEYWLNVLKPAFSGQDFDGFATTNLAVLGSK